MSDPGTPDLDHLAVELLRAAFRISERFPMDQAPLASELRRAAISVALDLSKGSHDLARTGASTCRAILDVVHLLGCVPDEELAQAKGLLARVAEGLS